MKPACSPKKRAFSGVVDTRPWREPVWWLSLTVILLGLLCCACSNNSTGIHVPPPDSENSDSSYRDGERPGNRLDIIEISSQPDLEAAVDTQDGRLPADQEEEEPDSQDNLADQDAPDGITRETSEDDLPETAGIDLQTDDEGDTFLSPEVLDDIAEDSPSETEEPADIADTGDTADVLDTSELTVVVNCVPFDDFITWSYTGDGTWSIDAGVLTEGRGGYYRGVAYTEDMGLSSVYRIQVDTAFHGSLNDFAGIAFAVDPVAESYWVVRWDDPNNDYGRYTPPGAMDISFCDSDGCTTYAQDDTEMLRVSSDLTWVTWSITIDGNHLTVDWEGITAMDVVLPALTGIGPGVVGVYSDDNDGGFFYDNFCVEWIQG